MMFLSYKFKYSLLKISFIYYIIFYENISFTVDVFCRFICYVKIKINQFSCDSFIIIANRFGKYLVCSGYPEARDEENYVGTLT